jgi:hypothetical protein
VRRRDERAARADGEAVFRYASANRTGPLEREPSLKKILCLTLVLALAGCIPIGARVSNMYAQTPAAAPRT